MKICGLKIVPVIISTIAIYAIGAIIYGLLFSQQWLEWSRFSESDFIGNEWRMALSWIMPLALSIFIGVRLKQAQVKSIINAIQIGAQSGIFLILTTRLYSFVYGIEKWQILALDSAHILSICMVGAIILSAMKAAD
jgi:Protein of unknown function (DUF1761)